MVRAILKMRGGVLNKKFGFSGEGLVLDTGLNTVAGQWIILSDSETKTTGLTID